MKKIVVTGPESSGKSTLCKHISESLFIPHVREFAREYIDSLGREYKEEDLTVIANGQLGLERDARSHTPTYLICDTDLLTIKIWSEYKYGKCDPIILDLYSNNLPDLYLLVSPNIPWKEDPQRENPFNREELYSIYKKEIIKMNIPFVEIDGTEAERLESSMKIFSNYFD